jgi:hypothetical protein
MLVFELQSFGTDLLLAPCYGQVLSKTMDSTTLTPDKLELSTVTVDENKNVSYGG